MSRGLARTTLLIVDIFEAQLHSGTGDLTPELDEIAIALRKQTHLTLKEARTLIEARLTSVLNELAERSWTAVKVTEYYVQKYKGQTPNHPDLDAEIVRCVAGRGFPLPTHAIHFCLSGTDCILFIEASIHGLQSGSGANQATLTRMKVAAETGLLTANGVERIGTKVPKQLTLGAVRRIAK